MADEEVVPEVETDTPALAAETPVESPADPPVEPESAVTAPEAPTPPAQPSVPKWALERVNEETNRRQQAEARARELEQIVQRLQTDPAKPAQPSAPATPRGPDQSAVREEAARQVMTEKIGNVNMAGASAYGAKWNEAVQALNAYGADTVDFVGSIIDIDPARAHEILFDLAQDGEKTNALARMSPTRRAAEVTRMIMAKAPATETKPAAPAAKTEPATVKPAARTVSQAPAPKPVLVTNAPPPELDPMTPDGDSKMSDAEWERWYKAKYYKKTG